MNYNEIDAQIEPVLFGVQEKGHKIDRAGLAAQRAEYTARNGGIAAELSGSFRLPAELNLNSPAQLNAYLTRVLRLRPLPETGKGNYANTAEILKTYGHPAVELVLRRRENDKMISFCYNILSRLDPDDRVHPRFIALQARTGRMSCIEPNIQNMPKELRKYFIAESGNKLVIADYAQQELRIFAHYADLISKSDKYLSAYSTNSSLDFHQLMADRLGITRQAAKTLNFATLYGAGVGLIAERLSIPLDKAKEIYNDYHSSNPEIRTLATLASQTAKRRGYVKTLSNRQIPYSGADKTFTALNAIIQGGGADITKLAVCRVYDRLSAENIPASTVNIIHDSIVVETRIEYAADVKNILSDEMIAAGKELGMQVPLATDNVIANTWN